MNKPVPTPDTPQQREDKAAVLAAAVKREARESRIRDIFIFGAIVVSYFIH